MAVSLDREAADGRSVLHPDLNLAFGAVRRLLPRQNPFNNLPERIVQFLLVSNSTTARSKIETDLTHPSLAALGRAPEGMAHPYRDEEELAIDYYPNINHWSKRVVLATGIAVVSYFWPW